MRPWLAGFVLIVAVGAAVAGCTDQGGNLFLHFSNRTNRPIDVLVLYPDTDHEFVLEAGIKPGTTSATRSDVYPSNTCSDRGVLIARDAHGTEIARRTGQICKGDTWVVGGQPTASAS